MTEWDGYQLYTKISRLLPNKEEYAATLVFGSAVEKRLNRPPKDIDVIGISYGENWRTGLSVIDGKKVEHFIRRICQIVDSIVARRNFFDTRNYAAGFLIQWREGDEIPAKLKRIAEVNWAKGPLRLRDSSHLFMRLKYNNLRD